MSASARLEVVCHGEVGVYHVWSRCVRRAFLCGTDPLTGKDHNHRRQWIHESEKQLAGLYRLEIGFPFSPTSRQFWSAASVSI